MAKMKVHELAKELNISSKEVLAFLQDKGIEAKAAQSSIEDSSVEIVRKAFGGKGDTQVAENKVTEEKEEAVEAVKPAVDDSQEAPKKKKKNIIFISNPQNSKFSGGQKPGNKPASGQGQNRPAQNQQGRGTGYNNGGNNGKNGGNVQPARTPIKPLTPPSPTPSVQMVKSQPQPKVQKEAPVQ